MVKTARPEAPPAASRSNAICRSVAPNGAGKSTLIKAMLGLSLVDSKKFVESAPKMMKEGVPKEEAEKIVETLKALGATAVME